MYAGRVGSAASKKCTGKLLEKPPSVSCTASGRAVHLARVPVGGEIHATIRARWSLFGALSPASQVRLFTEMTTPDGSEGSIWSNSSSLRAATSTWRSMRSSSGPERRAR